MQLDLDDWNEPMIMRWRVADHIGGTNQLVYWDIEGAEIDPEPVYLSDIYETFGDNFQNFFKKLLGVIREDVIEMSEGEFGFELPYTSSYKKLYHKIKIR